MPWTICALELPPFWRRSCDPHMLTAVALEAADEEIFPLSGSACVPVVARLPDRELLSLAAGHGRQCIEIVEGTVLDGPVKLRFLIDGWRDHQAQLSALAGLAGGRAHIATRRCAQPSIGQAMSQLLRIRDARMAGASHREIARLLCDAQRVNADWRAASDYLRSRVRRAVARAETMANLGHSWFAATQGRHLFRSGGQATSVGYKCSYL
ncbi:hypothetical protein SAMN06295912_12114 [Sphingomonas laterariae]|uniref:T6SS Transcription factor RovC-like DNA binding domain-containing protein n=1 Tax=Edaphosphingomonas laterariae TaxID=861865 RepID=A0A239I3L0_9SPHN|nr:DUF2285 domain-containing protein [Sphingomonas laterariae]SNS87878.1 hypothetical protein SAMN06295912_12114 [Sphingomonas laterariae]